MQGLARVMDNGILVFPQRGSPPEVRPGYVRDPGNPFNLLPINSVVPLPPCRYRNTAGVPCNCAGGSKGDFHTCTLGIPIHVGTCIKCVKVEEPVEFPIFRALWSELLYCLAPSFVYLNEFVVRIPCAECQAHWLEIVTKNNPRSAIVASLNGDYSLWQAWVVDRHNDVNRRLGKPFIMLDLDLSRQSKHVEQG